MTEAPGTEELIRRADELLKVLEEETALLDALDLGRAAALLPRKEVAVAALQDATGRDAPEEEPGEEEREELERSREALRAGVEANCHALTRSLELQTRLMQAIAKAVPAGRAAEAPSYQPDGRKVPARPPEAYAFQRRM
jgi:hypothetical protein